MQTEEYEHWVQQTCTADFKVRIRSASGSASVALPRIDVLGTSIMLAGVTVRASVGVELSLGLSASLTFDGTDAVYSGGRIQQSIKIGCRDDCVPFTNDIIFERTFQALNHNNFDAVDGVRGSLDPSVTFSLSAGILGNSGSIFGDWGFKIQGGIKLSVPAQMREGSSLSALYNPSRFFITGGSQSLAACSQAHTFDAQIQAKVDFTGLHAVIAVYWEFERELLRSSNLVTYDLIVFCSGVACQRGQYLSSGSCVNCAAGKYSDATAVTVCTNCVSGKYSTTSGATSSSTCGSCPANSNSPVGSNAQSDCTCNRGSSGPNGGPCTSCVAGTYKSSSGRYLLAWSSLIAVHVRSHYASGVLLLLGCSYVWGGMYTICVRRVGIVRRMPRRQVLHHLGRHILEHVRQLPCQLRLAGGEQRAERLYVQRGLYKRRRWGMWSMFRWHV